MAKNQRLPHNDSVKLTALTVLKSGAPVKIGQYVGFANADAAIGEQVVLGLIGSYDSTITGAVTEGQIIYITTANALALTATGNFPFGVANEAKAAAAGPVEIHAFGTITNTAALA